MKAVWGGGMDREGKRPARGVYRRCGRPPGRSTGGYGSSVRSSGCIFVHVLGGGGGGFFFIKSC